MKRRNAVSALDISKDEATLKGTPKEKLSAEFTRMYPSPARSSRRLAPHKPMEPRVDQDQRQSVPIQEHLHEDVRKYCEHAVGAIKMNSVYEANLLLRISIFFKHSAAVDILYMKACCWNALAGPIPLRIHFYGCILVAVAALGTGELMFKKKRRDFFVTAQRFPYGGHVQLGRMEHTTLADQAAMCLKRGGEIPVPASVKLEKCHYKVVLLDQLVVTRVHT